jgi:hypothetical protein
MKRGQLRPNPDKVRDWLARSRAKSSLNRSGRPARTKRKRRRPVPSETRALVLARSWGWCVACLAREGIYADALGNYRAVALMRSRTGGLPRPATQLHHVLPVTRWPDHELDADNMVGVCVECHDRHEHGTTRIPLEALGHEALGLIERLGGAAEVEAFRHHLPMSAQEPGRAEPGSR